jgi:hypothetical protein
VRTAHTLHFSFKACIVHSSVCGAATHAVGRDTGYGLLTESHWIMPTAGLHFLII